MDKKSSFFFLLSSRFTSSSIFFLETILFHWLVTRGVLMSRYRALKVNVVKSIEQYGKRGDNFKLRYNCGITSVLKLPREFKFWRRSIFSLIDVYKTTRHNLKLIQTRFTCNGFEKNYLVYICRNKEKGANRNLIIFKAESREIRKSGENEAIEGNEWLAEKWEYCTAYIECLYAQVLPKCDSFLTSKGKGKYFTSI